MRVCVMRAHPCICFDAGLCMMPGWMLRMMWVWMLRWVLVVLDGALTCAVLRRSQMIYFVLAVSVLGQAVQNGALLELSGEAAKIEFGGALSLIHNSTEDELVCSGKIRASDVIIEGTTTTVAEIVADYAAMKVDIAALKHFVGMMPPPVSPPPSMPPPPPIHQLLLATTPVVASSVHPPQNGNNYVAQNALPGVAGEWASLYSTPGYDWIEADLQSARTVTSVGYQQRPSSGETGSMLNVTLKDESSTILSMQQVHFLCTSGNCGLETFELVPTGGVQFVRFTYANNRVDCNSFGGTCVNYGAREIQVFGF